MSTSRCLLMFLLAATTYADLPLPAYIKPCARHDPNLHACALEHGKAAIAHLIKGDRKYGIPPLDPFKISEVRIPQTHYSLKAQDVTAYGLKDGELKKVQFNFNDLQMDIEVDFPNLELNGQYEIDGRILLLPISGKGFMNLTLEHPEVKYHSDLKIVKIDGKDHLEYHNPITEIKSKQVYFNLTNLFNGNKLLGDEMNALLNKEWKDASKDFAPPMIETLNAVITSMIDSFSKRVSFDAWFPETV